MCRLFRSTLQHSQGVHYIISAKTTRKIFINCELGPVLVFQCFIMDTTLQHVKNLYLLLLQTASLFLWKRTQSGLTSKVWQSPPWCTKLKSLLCHHHRRAKKYIFLSGWLLFLWPQQWMTFVVGRSWINIQLYNVQFNSSGNIGIMKWMKPLIESIVQLWSHYSVLANMTISGLLAFRIVHWLQWVNYLCLWNIMLVNIPNPGAVPFGTAEIMYFWTHAFALFDPWMSFNFAIDDLVKKVDWWGGYIEELGLFVCNGSG